MSGNKWWSTKVGAKLLILCPGSALKYLMCFIVGISTK